MCISLQTAPLLCSESLTSFSLWQQMLQPPCSYPHHVFFLFYPNLHSFPLASFFPNCSRNLLCPCIFPPFLCSLPACMSGCSSSSLSVSLSLFLSALLSLSLAELMFMLYIGQRDSVSLSRGETARIQFKL